MQPHGRTVGVSRSLEATARASQTAALQPVHITRARRAQKATTRRQKNQITQSNSKPTGNESRTRERPLRIDATTLSSHQNAVLCTKKHSNISQDPPLLPVKTRMILGQRRTTNGESETARDASGREIKGLRVRPGAGSEWPYTLSYGCRKALGA
jgi:hypothetical protein